MNLQKDLIEKLPEDARADSMGAVWTRIQREARIAVRDEPLLGALIHAGLLHHATFAAALAYRFSLKLASGEMSEQILREIADDAFGRAPELAQAAMADLLAVYERDPATHRLMQPILFFKGFQALQAYYPEANKDDWRLWQAGQRVQIIKRDADKGGVLKLGTEVVAAADGSIAGLLGASPGASTAAPIMLDLLQRAFKEPFASPAWQEKIREIVPSYGNSLNENPEQFQAIWRSTSRLLQLATADAEVEDEDEAGPGNLQPIDQSRETARDLDPELSP